MEMYQKYRKVSREIKDTYYN